MVDIKGTIQAGQSGFEKLVSSIPGYGGYKQKDLRRDADKVLRTFVAGKLDEQRRRLSDLQLQLISSGQLNLTGELDRAVQKVQLLVDRIKTATYGYAGFFDAVKVQEPQLDALYAFDSALLDEVAKVAAAVNALAAALAARQGVAEAIAAAVSTAQDANYIFGHREEVILQGAASVPPPAPASPPAQPSAPEPPKPQQ
jgi:hypothetical protein